MAKLAKLAIAIEAEIRSWRRPRRQRAQTWRVRIGDMQQDHLVVDIAERPPFASWRHEHRFEDIGAGRKRMTDHITCSLPFGPLGRIADRTFVR